MNLLVAAESGVLSTAEDAIDGVGSPVAISRSWVSALKIPTYQSKNSLKKQGSRTSLGWGIP